MHYVLDLCACPGCAQCNCHVQEKPVLLYSTTLSLLSSAFSHHVCRGRTITLTATHERKILGSALRYWVISLPNAHTHSPTKGQYTTQRQQCSASEPLVPFSSNKATG